MRLSDNEIKTIKEVINNILPSTIYVFGSRLDDSKKGGDLDLYLIPKKYPKDIDVKVGYIKMILEERLLLKVDIIIAKDKNKAIEKEALKGVMI
jgi:predicted nucleotidyltransferase